MKQDERDYLYLDKDKDRDLIALYNDVIERLLPYSDESYCDYIFNIEVEDSNTYFVTEMGILVST